MDCSMPGSSFLHYQSVLKFMSIELEMLSNHLIRCCPLLLPSIFSAWGSLQVSWFFIYGGQRTGASALVSVLPMNGQGWFPLGLTGLISLQSRGLSRVFSITTISKYQIFGVQPSFRHKSHVCTWLLEKTIALPTQTFDRKVSEYVSRSGMSNFLWTHGLGHARLLSPWDFPSNNTGVGCHALLQGILPSQGLNPGLLHFRQIAYHLNH